MKIIQAMRELRDLAEKAADLRTKVAANCANLSTDTPKYEDMKQKIREWTQSHEDTLKRILHLRLAIQRTNLLTNVTIELDGKQVTHTIAGWIHRRKDLAPLALRLWGDIGDGNRREGQVQLAPGADPLMVKIVRHWDPEERDRRLDLYRREPSIIDGHLEIVNATTDLLEGRLDQPITLK